MIKRLSAGVAMGVLALAACAQEDDPDVALPATTSRSTDPTPEDPTPVTPQSTAAAVTSTSTSPTTTGVPDTTAAPSTAAPPTTPASTAPPPTTPPPTAPPQISIEELNATLGPVAQAWAEAPSGQTYDALAQTANAVLASGRPLPQLVDGGADTRGLLQQLIVYPGSDLAVLGVFEALGPALPAVSREAFTTTVPPLQPAVDLGGGTDPRFDTCGDAIDAGYGPYRQGDPEYSWYRDADSDGVVCE